MQAVYYAGHRDLDDVFYDHHRFDCSYQRNTDCVHPKILIHEYKVINNL